ncbi:hypothetical protein IMZ48_13010, partial [Candidatus Bathyarchaeota archaeon]|nr:hypothetical protein [Candidatus Bathyarchaeota archaeon]
MPELVNQETSSDSVKISPSPSPAPPRRSRAKDVSEGGGSACGCSPGLAANLGVLVAVGAVLGFKAWGLYDRGVLGWR